MAALKTINVLIVSLAILLGVGAVTIGVVIGTSAADRHRVQMVRACVASGQQWVRGDCVRTH